MEKSKKNILVIKAHPALNTFNEALADEYIKGAKESGNKIKEISLRELKLAKYLKHDHRTSVKLSPDLINAQKLIKWADHLVFSYPIWWGTCPALMKEFIEIIFVPGFALEYPKEKKGLPVGLLKGKSARLIVTMNTPIPIYKIFLGDPNGKLMIKGTLNFCGIKSVKKSYFGPVKKVTQGTKDAWIYKAYETGKAEFK